MPGAVHVLANMRPQVVGQQAYTTAGSYNFTVPANVYNVCVVAVGGGGEGSSTTGGGGADLVGICVTETILQCVQVKFIP
jgi:hypothetical protein